ncbi:MAG: DUF3494 domain-containing protein [Burkholderiales bacterium]|nr:DUF3494 domain-containing protein [Burkholderiales bacterium]
MIKTHFNLNFAGWLFVVIFATLLSGCGGGGGKDPILGASVQPAASGGAGAPGATTPTNAAPPTTSASILGTAAAFGAFGGGAGVTNQGINTIVAGDLGTTAACTAITGFHDSTGTVYTETPLNMGQVTGTINCGPPAPGTTQTLAVATQAQSDARTAYNYLQSLAPGPSPGAGELGNLTLAPGDYTAAGGTFSITAGNLTLDGQGNNNATWVFQMASSLTVGSPTFAPKILLINNAQAKNVFWAVGSAATIATGSAMAGTIISNSGITFSTAGTAIQTSLIGRALSLVASVTMVNTTITLP